MHSSILLTLMAMTACFCGLKPPTSATKPYLVWSDEFEYSGLPDSTKWSYDVGGHGWGNKELQTYTEKRLKNARVENGLLIIETQKEPFNGMGYTSARLVSRDKGDWLYGRIEVRARLPRGTGTWPAIWMLSTEDKFGGWPKSGEIDIMEQVGFDPGVVHWSVHTDAYNHMIGTQKTKHALFPDAQDSFHVYSIDWTEEEISFFVDSKTYFSFRNEHNGTSTWPFGQPFYLIMNIAVGGNWGGQKGIDDSIWPQKLEVDYVRVFKKL